jgi:hypothetical protein
MQVFVLNDKKVPMTVLVREEGVSVHVSAKDFVLQPGDNRTVEFQAPEGSIPYVKMWNDKPGSAVTLVSYIEREALDNLDKLTKGLA